MRLFKRADNAIANDSQLDPGYNPERTIDLFARTPEGYIIAQDILCQHEYVKQQVCPETGSKFRVIAQLNRAFQGLNELVAISLGTGKRHSFIFDISNNVYQKWWSEKMGDLYENSYDGPPRSADPSQRYFRN